MKKLRFLLAILFAVPFIFTACDKNEADITKCGYPVTISFDDKMGDIDHIVAVVRNSRLFYLEVVDTAIGGNGTYFFTLPASVDTNYLTDIQMYFEPYYESLTYGYFSISDKNAQLADLYFRGETINEYPFQLIYKGDFARGSYVYADRAVKITGSYSYSSAIGQELRMNVSLNKGWNMMYINNYQENEIYVREYTTNKVEGLRWYAY